MKKNVLLLLFLIWGSFASFGQVLDQSNTPSFAPSSSNIFDLSVLNSANVGQSFRAGVTGPLSQISFKIGTRAGGFVAGSFQLKVYAGSGVTGTLLNTTNFSVTTQPDYNFSTTLNVPLSVAVAVTSGSTYTFDVIGVGTARVDMLGFNLNGYANGDLYLYGGEISGYELWFQTFYTPNTAPTDLTLSSLNINENVAVNTTVGSLSSTDANAGNTFTYSLVAGTGDTDNASFNINSNNLRIGISPNFEVKSSYSIRLRTTDQGGLFFDKQFTIAINNENEAVTDITLSNPTIAENLPANSVVGTLSSTDTDASNTFTYTLVSGTGSTGNTAFGIFGTVLRFTNIPNFEAQSSYSIRVRSTDQGGLFFEKQFTITVTDRDDVITDLTLSASAINENVVANSSIGNLQGVAATGNTYSYALVSGTGSTDNAAFNISSNSLRISSSPNFETKSSYAIRIRTTEQGGLFFEKQFTISINNLNEAPTDISLSSLTINENVAINTSVGSLTSNDPDTGNTFTYTLVSGTGSTDNASFNISGNSLRIGISPDFEIKSSYSIRLRSTDQGNSTFEKQFTISINDIVETPATHLNFDGANDHVTIPESVLNNLPQGTIEAWINLNALTNQTICAKQHNSQNTYSLLIVGGGGAPAGKLLFQAKNGSSIISATTLATGQWYHIAVEFNASGATIFINGAIDNAVSGNFSIPNASSASGTAIGAWLGDGGGKYFNGNIEEFRVWNTIASVTNIARRRNCELIGNEAGLLTYYKFNQGINASNNSAITALTATTGLNGALIGFTSTSSTSNWLAGSPVTTGSVIPSTPTVSTPVVFNQGETATALTATTGGTGLLWFTTATGGTGSTSAPTPMTTAIGTTSYWVSSTNASGCESARTEIVVNIIALIPATHLKFDGTNDHITIPESVLNNLPQGTIEAWINLSALTNQTICAKQHNGVGSYAILTVGGGGAAPGKLFFQAKGGSAITSSSTLAINQWYHVAVEFNATSATIFINGVLDATVSGNFSVPNASGSSGTAIGAWLGDGGGQYFNGSIDEFRVWNSISTQTNIARRRNCELAGTESGLLTYYKFNQGSNASNNTSITALTATTGVNGTLINFAKTGLASNFLAGSPVTTGSVIPSPPTADAQTFCGTSTVSNLVPMPSATTNWYNVATGSSALLTSTALTTGTYYVSSVNANGCESARTIVSITVNAIPTVPTAAAQAFCKSTTPADLVSTESGSKKWYTAASGGTALASDADLSSGNYYVSQITNGCESPRSAAVAITVNTTVWNGTTWSNGAPDAAKGAVFTGNYSQTADFTTCNLDVKGTAVVSIPTGSDITVGGKMYVAPTASLTFENNANLLQTSTTTNTDNGNIIFKRNTEVQRLAYTNWSSPVANQNALAFSPLTIATRFYSYNEAINAFVELASPSTTTLVPAVGYGIRAPNTFADAPAPATAFVGSFTGIPNNGNYTYAGTKTGANGGYNLVGNPYPSTLLASEFFIANPNVTALYFWNNAVLGSIGGANYATKTTLTGTRATSDVNSLKVPNDFIGVGQGFYAYLNANATLNFNNAMRSSDNSGVLFFRNATTDKSLFKLNLLSSTNTFNQIAIGYMNGATSGVDNQIDAVPFAQSATMVSSLINNVDYVIQGRSLPFANTDVVPLGFKTDVAGNYSFNTEAFEGVFANTQNIFIKDNLAGITHNIKQSAYQFTSNAGTFNSRFEIVYVNSILGIDNPNFDSNNVFVFVKNDNININSGKINMKNIQVFDIRGRLVFDKKEVNATAFEIQNLKVEQAVLVVKITSEDGQIVSKKIIF